MYVCGQHLLLCLSLQRRLPKRPVADSTEGESRRTKPSNEVSLSKDWSDIVRFDLIAFGIPR